MSELTLWKDQEMRKLRRDLDRLFSRCWSDVGVKLFVEDFSERPQVEMTETEDAIIVRARLKDVKPEDLEVTATEDTLTISGKKQVERVKDTGYHHTVERRLRSFTRSIHMPCNVDVDRVEASFKKGTLKITLPKEEAKKACGIKVEVE